MGRNNREQRSKDVNWGFNITKQTPFKFEVLTERQCRNFELAKGLEMFKLTMAIRINGKHNLENNDQIEIKGNKYIVLTMTNNFDNPAQGRFKGNLDDFTGSTTFGLE